MPSNNNEEFFDEQTERSRIKATIVAKYLYVWSKIIIGQLKERPREPNFAAYVDLFAGPGRYEDGQESTPLLVLQRAIKEDDLRQYLRLVFNEKDPDSFARLQAEVNSYPGVDTLNYPPAFLNEQVGDNKIEQLFTRADKPRPAMLVFVDPWGYNGLTIELLHSVLQHWGCEIIIFFNYQRINPALSNKIFNKNMGLLFGTEKASELSRELDRIKDGHKGKIRSQKREEAIIAAVEQALHERVSKSQKSNLSVYTVDYRFRDPKHGTRTTHHLIFATTNPHGFLKMKEVMAGESRDKNNSIGRFEFGPDKREEVVQQLQLFQPERPIDALAEELLKCFAGQRITVGDIIFKHHVTGKYIGKNYKDALRMLEDQGRVVMMKSKNERPAGTLGDKIQVFFVNLDSKAP